MLHPHNPQAGSRLLTDIRNLVARSHRLSVSGGARSFTITKPGLPIPRIVLFAVGREILGSFDLTSFAPLLSPATTLASNPAFQRARSQLLPGSLVPLFINFGPLASLLGQTPQFRTQPRDEKALGDLRRLDYFVFGENAADHDARFVLGLR